MMYIRRKVFSILDTEIGERLFSTTDYILDQREFTGETKRRNKALKRQWFEKMGEKVEKDPLDIFFKRVKDKSGAKFGQKGAGDVYFGRRDFKISQGHDDLAFKERIKRKNPEEFKANRKSKMISKEIESWRNMINEPDPKPTTVVPEKALVVSNSKPTTVVPEKALVVSNSKPVVKTESKLSKLAKNKYVQAGAGLLALGGTAAGGYYLLNKKNKKDKEDKE